GRAFADGVGRTGGDGDVGVVIGLGAAVERRADVGAVALHLEAVTGIGLAVGADLGHAHHGRGLQRIRDRAGRSVTEVRERAGAVLTQARGVVREVGSPGRPFRDRVRVASGDRDVDALAAVDWIARVGAAQLDLE